MHCLRIKILDSCPNREELINFYENKVKTIGYKGDCGVDLIFPCDYVCPVSAVTKCGLGIACEFIPANQSQSGPFDLVARSSIANTPLMLANGIGIFDPEYRGEVIAAFRCFHDKNHISDVTNLDYHIQKGQRLVQIVAPDRQPILVELVKDLTTTSRGSHGFGSTNC